MICTCDNCHYSFEAESLPLSCPDCGKEKINRRIGDKINSAAAVRPATSDEIAWYEENQPLPLCTSEAGRPEKACPLLKGNKCSVHRGKPTVCALFPLGRAMRYAAPSSAPASPSPASSVPASPVQQAQSGNAENGIDGTGENEMFYFFNGATCGARDQEHTVAEWLSEFNLQESEAWFLEWSKELGEIAITIHDLEQKLRPKLMEPIFGAVFTGMYLNYYAGASFMDQFRANSQKVKEMLAAIKAEIEKG